MSESLRCISCDSEILEFYITESPISGYKCDSIDQSLLEKSFKLIWYYCPTCNLVRYPLYEDAVAVLDRLYSQHTSTYYFTKELSEYLDNFVSMLSSQYDIKRTSRILEIGCNDGRLLGLFHKTTGCYVIGVEPSKSFRKKWGNDNLEVINDYFGEQVLDQLKNKTYDLIIFRHVYEHIPDPVEFLANVAALCTDETKIIIEVPYLVSVLKDERFDNISYSHLNYFSLRSINRIAKRFNFGIIDYSLEKTDGGSIVIHLQKNVSTKENILDQVLESDILKFIDSIDHKRIILKQKISGYKNHEVVGYGAGAKGPHLLYLFNLTNNLEVIVDDIPENKGKYIPGTLILIQPSSYLENKNIKAVLNLAPTHSSTIRAQVPTLLDFIDLI